MKKLTYKSAGVNTQKAQELLKKVSSFIQETQNPNSSFSHKGGFAGSYTYQGNIFLASCDGIGTKIQIAHLFQDYSSLGYDLVGMCVNDLYAAGGEPLFFLDYISCASLEEKWYLPFMRSLTKALKEIRIPLLGGETAEHPGVLKEGDFDVAGFVVGVQKRNFPHEEIQEGDLIYALPSDGVHSNGYSLIRKLLSLLEKENTKLYKEIISSSLWKKELLKPTKIYQEIPLVWHLVKGVAHITGGGIYENLIRILPEGKKAIIEEPYIFQEVSFLFSFLEEYVEKKELFSTFNMGIGMVFILDPTKEKEFLSLLPDAKRIGYVEKGKKEVCLREIDF